MVMVMVMETNKSDSASSLAMLWVIESLASFKEVPLSLLHDVSEIAPKLPNEAGKNAREMLALRCLEGLNGIKKDVPFHDSKITFDSSERCEDVLQRIFNETSDSAIKGGSAMLKWDVSPFIARKKASTRSTLKQLKDSILDGTHPYADFLMEKSGLASVNKRDNIPTKNDDCIVLNKSLASSSSSDPQSEKDKSKQSPLLREVDRRMSEKHPNSFSLLPSKRRRIDSSSKDEARQLPCCDNVLYSGEEATSPPGAGLLEKSSETVVPQHERDDTNLLSEFRMETSEGDKIVKEHSGSKRSEQCVDVSHQGPCNTMMAPANEGDNEMHKVDIEIVKDRGEFSFDPKSSNDPLVDETLHKTSTNGSKCDVGNDDHVKEINTVSHSGFLPKTVAIVTDDNMNLYEEVKDTLSDSNEDLDEQFDIALKKNEFISSQTMGNHDSLVSGLELTLCMKCNKGGQLLSCNMSNCPLVVHEKCLGSSVWMNDRENFYCPFCAHSLTISEYLEAKKEAALAKKNLATFMRICLEHQPIVISGGLQGKNLGHSRKARVQDVEICENVNLGNNNHQLNPNGEHLNEVLDPKICQDVNLGNKDSQVNPDEEHLNEVIDPKVFQDVNLGNQDDQINPDEEDVNDHQFPKIIDTEQIIQVSESSDIANSKHRENEANALRVASDALACEKDKDGLADQECQANTVAQLEDNLNTIEHKHDIHTISVRSMNSAHTYQGLTETATEQQVLQNQTDDSEEEPVYALNIEGESSDDDNDESIMSKYYIRFRQKKYHHTCPASPQLRRKRLRWTAEEEETLKEGVQKFYSCVESSPATIPWKMILDFGSSVFLKGRTTIDLKDKWRNLCNSPKST